MKRNLILLFAVLIVILYALSCSPVPPVKMDLKTYTDLDATFDEVWEAVIAHFADNMYTIQTIEKSSGIIVTERITYRNGPISDGYAGNKEMNLSLCNCGKHGSLIFGNLYVKFNVFVREIDKNKTRIQVNAKFWTTYYDALGENRGVWDCVSTGQLEKWLISEVETKYLKKK